MLSSALYSTPADVDSFIDRAFFDLMKSTADIHENQHELTSDCIHQIKIAVNVLNGIIHRRQQAA